MPLAFSHLNLRVNPFGEASVEDRSRLAVVDAEALAEGEIVQFIGDSGRGKTTHLLALASRHQDAVYEKLEEGRDHWAASVPRDAPFLLDEAQRAHPQRLRALLAGGGTIALGTHADLSSLAPRPIRTVRVGGIGMEKLEAIVARRIEWARRGPGRVPFVSRSALSALEARHGDDMRGIIGELYDVFQTLREVGPVTV
jgi:energy-coupling factor transporter ATP-binding protein EcfA2